MKQSIAVFWFRRDLRLEDNAGLYHALKGKLPVVPIFIFDRQILDKLQKPNDLRVEFIHREINRLREELQKLGSDLMVKHQSPLEVFSALMKEYRVEAIYTNHDYEPYAIARDQEIQALANSHHGKFLSYKDQCIFEKDEVSKDDGKPYTVFTPYMKKWKLKLQEKQNFWLKPYPTHRYFSNLLQAVRFEPTLTLKDMGFTESNFEFPAKEVAASLIQKYTEQRNFPAIRGTSHLGIHFRFGTISIRQKVGKAIQLNETYLNECIWRDFYMQILWHFPHVAHSAFKAEYNYIEWRNNESEFGKWTLGQTGYPIVDAGMRELNATGFMHNRVRMIVASFLCKHLLIDWRWGEAYFAQKLLDFDLSANNGGWQWAAGCGTDAAPYFRVFNPALQTEKFDKNLVYIKKWVPELNSLSYPKPIVNHELARKRCLETYKKALQEHRKP